MAGIVQRGDKKFLALAFEFFLRCLEVCNPCCDFFPLPGDPLLLFGHAHPFFESCLTRIGGSNWGANWGAALRDCGCQPRSRIPGAFRAAVL